MPKGGARVNSGPPPDPNALRRDRASDKDGWTLLPAAGRTGDVPDWPLLDDLDLVVNRDTALNAASRIADELAIEEDDRKRIALQKRLDSVNRTVELLDRKIEAQRDLEASLWRQVWSTPQAVAWERLGWVRDVAQYVRHKVLAELGSLDQAKEARQWSDRLGLNPAAMLRNRWKIAPDEVAAKRSAGATAGAGRKVKSSRDRFKVVDGGDGGA